MDRTFSPRSHLNWLLRRGRLPGTSDKELLARFVSDGEEIAFEELVSRHGSMVLGVCRRRLEDPEDIEDAFQATFLVLIQRARSMDREATAGGWLHTVAVRVSDRARARTRRQKSHVALREDNGPISPTGPDAPEHHEIRQALDDEIRRLPASQRRVVTLCWLVGRTHQQAADELGWPLGTVKSRLAAARQRLRGRLSRRGIAPALAVSNALLSLESGRPDVPDTLARRALELARPLILSRGFSASGKATLASSLYREVSREMRRVAFGKAATVGLAVAASVIAAAGFLTPTINARSQPQDEVRSARTPPPPRVAAADRFGDPLPAGAIARIGTVRYRQSDRIQQLCFAPDGRSLITDVGERLLQVWAIPEGRPVRIIDPQMEAVRDFDISPDGKTIAAVGFSFSPERRVTIHQLLFLDLATGHVVARGEWDGREANELAYSPDGKHVATNSDDGTLRIWDAMKAEVTLQSKVGERSHRGLAYAPSGELLAIGTFGNGGRPYAVQLVNPDTGKVERVIDGLEADVYGVTFAPDGRSMAIAASNAGGFSVWDVSTGRELQRHNVKAQNIQVLRYAPNGRTLCAIADSGDISFWDVASGRLIRSISRPNTVTSSAAFTPDGKWLAANGGDTALHLYDARDGRDLLEVPDAHLAEVMALAYSEDGKLLVTAGDDGIARAWDLATFRPRSPVLRHEGWVRAVAASADGRRLLTGANWPDGKVRLWGLRTGTLIREWSPPAQTFEYPIAVAFSPPDGSVLACWNTGKISHWDPDNGAEREVVQPRFDHQNPMGGDDLAPSGLFSPQGDTLSVLTHFSGELLVADLPTGRQRFETPAFQSSAYSQDGRQIVVGRRGKPKAIPLANGQVRFEGEQAEGIIALLDAETGKEQRSFVIPRCWISAVAISPDGRLVAASTYFEDGKRTGGVHVFRTSDGEEVMKRDVPSACTRALSFTPDGKRLVGGLRDTSVLIWDVGLGGGSHHPGQGEAPGGSGAAGIRPQSKPS